MTRSSMRPSKEAVSRVSFSSSSTTDGRRRNVASASTPPSLAATSLQMEQASRAVSSLRQPSRAVSSLRQPSRAVSSCQAAYQKVSHLQEVLHFITQLTMHLLCADVAFSTIELCTQPRVVMFQHQLHAAYSATLVVRM